jgi:hypothetical protein
MGLPQIQFPKSAVLYNDVQFTVFRPCAALPGRWYSLLAFAHLSEKGRDAPSHESNPMHEVNQQAMRLLGESEFKQYQPLTQDSTQAVPHDGLLTFKPYVEGITFNPARRSFRWNESVHREEFRFIAGAALDRTTARGRLSVFLGHILIADVPLAIRVDSGLNAPMDGEPLQVESARPYRRIFASYSHKDAHIVRVRPANRVLRSAWWMDGGALVSGG